MNIKIYIEAFYVRYDINFKGFTYAPYCQLSVFDQLSADTPPVAPKSTITRNKFPPSSVCKFSCRVANRRNISSSSTLTERASRKDNFTTTGHPINQR